MCALLTALKASARLLWVARAAPLLEVGLCGSAAARTCSVLFLNNLVAAITQRLYKDAMMH